ncbi:sensor histidine kinase [Halorubrum vacuolatum]|uniref:histidine kinase n=1 Tax=Halorubrum vacuolatum TaxID=63740 RepID=A0A238VEN8_HALVU|nr:ATP-binding protein [Halorubrum vacuolatum]SNR32872.1 Signal transduction histidine kinase [Halorubrum vacuolatum]
MCRRAIIIVFGNDRSVTHRVHEVLETLEGVPSSSVEPVPFTGGSTTERCQATFQEVDGGFSTGAADSDGFDPRALDGDVFAVVAPADSLDDIPLDRFPHELHATPTLAIARSRTPERYREAFLHGADDVFGPHTGSADEDPLREALRNAMDRTNRRLPPIAVESLRTVVLDAATTLMGAETDEVATKVEWTLENVGTSADLDRIVVYRDVDGMFNPAFAWAAEPLRPDPRAFESFPSPERLARFENVVSGDISTEKGDSDVDGPLSSVHVPLVSEWELVGVVVFEVETPRTWADAEVDLYRTLADLIAHMLARNERRRELRQQAERLEQFSTVVSHDLRNPLNVMAGYLDLAADDLAPEHYRPTDDALRRMETLIDDLLMLARRGDAIGETEPVPVRAIAEDAWHSVRTPRATLAVVEGLGHIEADPSRLRQLFENLFRNSIDHGGHGVTVEVGPRVSDGQVIGMYVADDGPGIPSDVRESVFESGFSTAGSSGIGLAIVARVAEGHGWTVEVDSDGGAIFEFEFAGREVRPPADRAVHEA